MDKENRCALVNGDNFVYCRQKFPIEEYDITPHAIIGALSKARAANFAGGTAYVSTYPCATCAKALAAAHIKRIVYQRENKQDDGLLASQVLNHFGIEVIHNPEVDL